MDLAAVMYCLDDRSAVSVSEKCNVIGCKRPAGADQEEEGIKKRHLDPWRNVKRSERRQAAKERDLRAMKQKLEEEMEEKLAVEKQKVAEERRKLEKKMAEERRKLEEEVAKERRRLEEKEEEWNRKLEATGEVDRMTWEECQCVNIITVTCKPGLTL